MYRLRSALHRRRHRALGLTLLETLTTTAIVAGTVAAGAPTLENVRERRRFEADVATVVADVQLARQEAVARHSSLVFAAPAAGAGRCYVLHTGATGACACDAEGGATCDDDAAPVRQVRLASATLRLPAAGQSMRFDPAYGTVTPTGTLRLQHPRLGSVNVVVNVLGRVRACTPDGALWSVAAC